MEVLRESEEQMSRNKLEAEEGSVRGTPRPPESSPADVADETGRLLTDDSDRRMGAIFDR